MRSGRKKFVRTPGGGSSGLKTPALQFPWQYYADKSGVAGMSGRWRRCVVWSVVPVLVLLLALVFAGWPGDTAVVAGKDPVAPVATFIESQLEFAGPDWKIRICDSAGSFCKPLKRMYRGVVKHASMQHWIPFFSAFGFAYLAFLVVSGFGGRPSFVAGLKYLFPRHIYLHRSAVLDYKFYLSGLLLNPFISILGLLFSATVIAGAISAGMTFLFGAGDFFEPGPTSGLFYTTCLLLIVDLGYYLAHYLSHKLPVLWEFHKVHHATEVLTPVSLRRMHPVDMLVGYMAFGLSAGIFNGLYSWAGHGGVDPMTIPGTVGILFVFRMTNVLKHSHIWLSFGQVGSRLLNSPAQHQLHHSIELRHRGCNYGRVFAVWDWMFGTLYVPRRREEFRIGLDAEEHLEFRSLVDCYLLPFVKIARSVAGRK